MIKRKDVHSRTLSEMESVSSGAGTSVQRGSHPVPYTEEQKKEFVKEFERKRRRQYWAFIGWAAFVIALGVTSPFRDEPPEWPFWFGLLYLIGYLVFNLIDWRCPACGENFGRNIGPTHCPKCGIVFKTTSKPGPDRSRSGTGPCPFCGKPIAKRANRCRHCLNEWGWDD
jgi:hypothetical protein